MQSIPSKHSITRRRFIQQGTILAGAASISPAFAASPNETVRIAIVGMGWLSPMHVKIFSKLKNVRIVAFCDPDSDRLQKSAKKFEATVGKIHLVKDYRRLLERKDIDAVVLSTPNHWHALQTIWACQAGKDVYVEKPCSHTIWEGQQMIKAARRYNRIVQVGLQTSSIECLPELSEWLRAGNIGAIQAIHGVFYSLRNPIGKRTKPMTPPKSLDYNLWLGPAQDQPIHRNEIHYDWHWDYNTGNGDIANLGSHTIDIARAILGDPKADGEIISLGRRFAWDDAGQSPNMHLAAYQLGGVPVIHEANNFPISPGKKAGPAVKGTRRGVVVICEGGYFMGHGQGKVFDNDRKTIKQFNGKETHRQDFVDAVISRKRNKLSAEIARGYESCKLPLLANIAHWNGEATSVKEVKDTIGSNPWLSEAHARYQKQLEAHGIDFEKEPWILGAGLNFDAKIERFSGVGPTAEKANSMLKRQVYRAPFTVPEKV